MHITYRTYTGTCPISKTYTSRKQFLDEGIAPLSDRLSKQLTPKVRALYADGDTVIAFWDGSEVAKDGKPYNNTYSWYMTMKNDCIVKAIAFLTPLNLQMFGKEYQFDAHW